MAVTLPTSADVKKLREQAAKTTAEQVSVVKTPLLAVLGAGEQARANVVEAFTAARTKATERVDAAQKRAAAVPGELSELRAKLTTEELAKLVDEVKAAAEKYYGEAKAATEKYYAGLAETGEQAWSKIRQQSQVKQAFEQFETLTGKLDTRVDEFVDEAHDVAEKALETVTHQTRSIGEKVALRTRKAATTVADKVGEVSAEAGEAVTEAGAEAAEAIQEAGTEAASATRSTARKVANRTAPKSTTRKAAAPKE